MSMETKTVYFEEPGPENTEATLRLARERAAALGIRDVVVASYTGHTGAQAAEVFEGCNLIVVAGVVGPDRAPMPEDERVVIEAAGGKILFTGHAFGMLGRAVNKRFNAIQADELIAHVLRLFSQGVKVGCEIACMAADAGLVRPGEEIVTIAGSAKGADTAMIVRASNTHAFFDTRVLEILCKPRS